jgi:NH3-dependent NAD+ synthetase
MSLFDLFIIVTAGYFFIGIYQKAKLQQRALEVKVCDIEIKKALLSQPYYYYDLVKNSDGDKQYLLYAVRDDSYQGQSNTLNGIKKLAKNLHPEYNNIFVKNPVTNKISVV